MAVAKKRELVDVSQAVSYNNISPVLYKPLLDKSNISK